MTGKVPGKSHRKGLTLLEIADMFGDEESAKHWIAVQRWPNGAHCPRCGSFDVQSWIKHPSQTHRCRDCDGKPMFSVKTGTVMEGSNLKYRVWAIGIYLFSTNIKGISSMRLHREIGIGQKAAWFMLARLRKAYDTDIGPFAGPSQVDESYWGGKEKNKHASQKAPCRRGTAGKTAVVGIKDQATNQVTAKVIKETDAKTLQGFVQANTADGSTVSSDEAVAYKGLKNRTPRNRDELRWRVCKRHGTTTNGIESPPARMMRRGHQGIYHHFVSEGLLDPLPCTSSPGRSQCSQP